MIAAAGGVLGTFLLVTRLRAYEETRIPSHDVNWLAQEVSRMSKSFKSLLASLLLTATMSSSLITAADASTTTYKAGVTRARVRQNTTYWQRHPKVKSAAVGAGVGTAAGALTGLVTGRGVVRGAAIGAGTGAGVGLIRSSRTMKRHPIVNDTATGAAVGLGLGWAGGRGHHTALKTAGVGAAIGMGVGLFKHLR